LDCRLCTARGGGYYSIRLAEMVGAPFLRLLWRVLGLAGQGVAATKPPRRHY